MCYTFPVMKPGKIPVESPVEEVARLRLENASLLAKAEFLEDENRLLRAILYGKSSEKKPTGTESPLQKHFSFDEADGESSSPKHSEPQQVLVKEHARQKPGRKPIIDTLPRVEEIIDHSRE